MLQETFYCWQNALLMDTQGLQHSTRLYIRASSIFSNDGGEPEKTNTRLTRIFGFYFISIF